MTTAKMPRWEKVSRAIARQAADSVRFTDGCDKPKKAMRVWARTFRAKVGRHPSGSEGIAARDELGFTTEDRVASAFGVNINRR
ncbi:MAG: hypothetical protein ACYTBJ_23845 [Planctomycetota bacterium]|jgi:hypothetical protein